MADGPGSPKKTNRLWIVLIAALAILLVIWIVFTAVGPEEADTPEISEEALTAPGESLETPPPVELPDGGLEPIGEAVEDPDQQQAE